MFSKSTCLSGCFAESYGNEVLTQKAVTDALINRLERFPALNVKQVRQFLKINL